MNHYKIPTHAEVEPRGEYWRLRIERYGAATPVHFASPRDEANPAHIAAMWVRGLDQHRLHFTTYDDAADYAEHIGMEVMGAS